MDDTQVPRLLRVDMTELEVLTMLRLASLGAATQQMLLTVQDVADDDGEMTLQQTLDLERATRMMQRTTDQVMRMDREDIVAWNTFVDKLHAGVYAAFGLRAVQNV